MNVYEHTAKAAKYVEKLLKEGIPRAVVVASVRREYGRNAKFVDTVISDNDKAAEAVEQSKRKKRGRG